MAKLPSNPKIFIAIIAAIFFLPFLGGVHLFDWDEVNFAEISREMVTLGNYLQIHINYESFTEKPPGFFWLQAISMNVFGIGEYAARFPNAVFGIITLVSLFFIGNKIKGKTFGVLWALAYFGSILPNLYFKSGIIDPVFNYFIFMGISYLIFHFWKKEGHKDIHLPKSALFYLVMAGIFTGCAMLVKGPVAYIITGLVFAIYWVRMRFKFYIKPLNFIYYTIIAIAVTGIWYSLEILVNGPTFVQEFFIRQWELFSTKDAGHGGFPGYHFVVLFLGCFPSTAFAIQSMLNKDKENNTSQDFKSWMTILFWAVLLLFTIVSTKIVHYSSMAYFPITYLGALSLYKIFKGEWKFKMLHKVILILTIVPIFIAPIAFTYIGFNPQVAQELLSQDAFAAANLDANINWTGLEVIPSIIIVIVAFLSFKFFKNNKPLKASYFLFGGTAVWVFLTLIFFIKRVEGISQRANIEFWESKKQENCYFYDYKYKTYTHFFYGEVKPDNSKESKDPNYLISGNIDKPVYISCKIHKEKDLVKEIPSAILLYKKNGFCFYKRAPKQIE